MTARPAGPGDLVSARVVLKAFQKLGTLREVPRRAAVVSERFPQWRLAWASLDAVTVKLLVEVPFATNSPSPWAEPLFVREEWLLTVTEEDESGES